MAKLEVVADSPFRFWNPSFNGMNMNDNSLAVYHLPIMERFSNRTVSSTWHECIAPRDSNAISSCLSRYIMEQVPNAVTHLDVSSIQKHWYLTAAFVKCIMDQPYLEIIDHRVVGIDHLAATDFAQINTLVMQKWEELSASSHLPPNWNNIIELVNVEGNHPHIQTMTETEFFNFKSLYREEGGPLKMPTANTDGEMLSFLSIKWFRFRKSSPFLVQYKTNLEERSPFKTFNLIRSNQIVVSLEPTFSYPRPLSIIESFHEE